MPILAFKDSGDGYYQCEVSDGEIPPQWTEALTPIDPINFLNPQKFLFHFHLGRCAKC